MKNSYTITSQLKPKEVLTRLTKLTCKRGSILNLIRGKKLIGDISGYQFKLQTYSSPPIQLTGTIENEGGITHLKLLTVSDSFEPNIKILVYAILYPFLIVMFILKVVLDPSNIWVYIITLVIALCIYVFGKIVGWLNSAPKTSPENIIDFITQKIDGEISENQVN